MNVDDEVCPVLLSRDVSIMSVCNAACCRPSWGLHVMMLLNYAAYAHNLSESHCHSCAIARAWTRRSAFNNQQL